MALDDVGGVGSAEDGYLAEDLAADGGVGVAVHDFQGVDRGCVLVADFMDCAAVAVAEDLELLEVGCGDGGGGGCGCGGWWEREGEARAAVGGFGEREAEVELAAVADYGHEIANVRRRREIRCGC